jgi:hypothetical protein
MRLGLYSTLLSYGYLHDVKGLKAKEPKVFTPRIDDMRLWIMDIQDYSIREDIQNPILQAATAREYLADTIVLLQSLSSIQRVYIQRYRYRFRDYRFRLHSL